MKKDVLALANLQFSEKRPSKETLNNPGLIYLASGLDPYTETPSAYREAYRSLGIDIINRVPEHNAPTPLKQGEVKDPGNGYKEAYLGLYNTYYKYNYPFQNVDEFWSTKKINPCYNDLITPVPHSLKKDKIERKMSFIGDIGLYYYMLYTTLFMWGVEYLGWEIFLMAAAMDPEGFNEKYIEVVFQKSLRLISILSELDSPFIFCHDDLADSNGPICSPEWYEKYIFPKYVKLWKSVKNKNKKIIFVADGNMSQLIEPLKATGIDGVMFENPATNFDSILRSFSDMIIIGGIETNILSRGSPEEIKKHVYDVNEKTKGHPGFAMSTPGGIHGSIPLENLEAYFDTRVKTGHTPPNWKKISGKKINF